MITELESYNLRQHNTFRLEATAARWIEFTEKDDLPRVASMISGGKFRCIGGGSNMLFTADYDGTLVHPALLNIEARTDADGNLLLTVGAGVELDSLVARLAEAGIWGMENLSLIPGEMGAAAVQNVGAYGVEIKDFVQAVECYDLQANRFVTLTAAECAYDYRYSIFKESANRERYIVAEVLLLLPADAAPRLGYGHLASRLTTDTPTPVDVREAVIAMRGEKLPAVEQTGSAGSFFKNPVISAERFASLIERYPSMPHYAVGDNYKIPAAWLIEQAGMKGRSVGGARVWERQPLVIVNADGSASAADILALEQEIINSVKLNFDIVLSPEVDHI